MAEQVTCSGWKKVHLVDEDKIKEEIVMPDVTVRLCNDCATVKTREERIENGGKLIQKLRNEVRK